MSFSQSLLPEFDQEMKSTRKLLECVPDGKMDYQPHAKSMTLGRLALHVAELPSWVGPTVDQDVLELPSDFKPRSAQSKAELLAAFDKAVAEARPKIEATSDAKWQQPWSLKFGGNTVFTIPRGVVMRSVVMNHLIHHRAQLGVFLRLNDIAIPGMYGPSADEGMMTAAS